MTCESCKQRDATIEFTTVAGDEKKTAHLCAVCAAEISRKQAGDESPGTKPPETKPPGAESKGNGPATPVKKKKVNVVVGHLAKSESRAGACPDCGMTYDEFRKVGRLGCASCYAAFADPLKRLLKRIHGASHHTGRHPGASVAAGDEGTPAAAPQDELDRLQAELARAVEEEAYEKAAQLRDRIARLREDEEQAR